MSRLTVTVIVILAVLVLLTVTPLGTYGIHEDQLAALPSYSVSFESTPLRKQTLDALSAEQLYPMRHSNGSLYVCVLPTQAETDRMVFESSVLTERYRDGSRAPDHVARRIHDRFARHGCLTVVTNGWWTYEFCWQRHVLQYRLDPSSVPAALRQRSGILSAEAAVAQGMGFVLGNVTGPSRAQPNRPQRSALFFGTDTVGRYIGTTYRGGTWCGLRHGPRKVHVRVYCAPGTTSTANTVDNFSVLESDTCEYVVRVAVVDACLPELGQSHVHKTLPCHPIQSA